VAEQKNKIIEYYRARAADMLAKAQEAPSKATRAAYLNLARVWTRHAETVKENNPPSDPTDGPHAAPENQPPVDQNRNQNPKN
jgi:hypothetical protein